jgi:opacity protein-like surface antigen
MRNPLAPALLAILLVPSALAQERPRNPARGWYVGAEAGVSQVDGDFSYEGDVIPFEEEDRALAFHAGYRFNRVVSLGAYIADYGSFSATRQGYAADANVDAFGLQFVGRVPLGEKFGLMGIAMLFCHDMDFTARVPDGSVLEDDGGGINVRFGLGLNYQLNPHLDLRLEILRTDGLSHGFMTLDLGPLDFDGNLNSVTLGMRYKF